MAKKKNYYQVHKNKKPKKQLPKSLHPKIIECIALAFDVVNKAIRRSQVLAHLSQPIPKYKLGSSNSEIVGGVITGEDKTEYFVTVKGEKIKIPEPTNFDRNAKHIGRYEEITNSIKERMNLISITSDELMNANNNFLDMMRKI